MPTCWAISRTLQVHRTALDGLDQEKQQVAAVQHRNRQQVDDRQVDADDGDELKQAADAGLGLIAGHLGDHDRPADGVDGNVAR